MTNSLENGLSLAEHEKEIVPFYSYDFEFEDNYDLDSYDWEDLFYPISDYSDLDSYDSKDLFCPQSTDFQQEQLFAGVRGGFRTGYKFGFFKRLLRSFLPQKNRTTKKELVSNNSQPILSDILQSEKAIGRRGNTFPLVVLATIFFETEIKWCLCERIRPIAEDLILAINQHKKSNFNTEALNAWIEKKTDTTMATVVMLLHGLRWAIQQDNKEVKKYILDLFEDEFLNIGSKKAFALAANEIRENYRNPALHGRKTEFSQKEYEKLARLIIGKKSFRTWSRSNKNDLQADSGILHGHLSLAKNYPAPEMSG